MKLCDIHTHVLPGVDDGAPDREHALEMLRNAVASEVEQLVVTPHCHSPLFAANYMDDALLRRFAQFKEAAADLPLQLMLGAEVHYSDRLPARLRSGCIPTLNGSRYLLTEFPPDWPGEAFPAALQSLLDSGVVPLVAHPERYIAVCRDPDTVATWLDMGCHLQLTGGSLMGDFGRLVQQTATHLLKNDFVACIASDAHGTQRRSNFLLDVYDHLYVQYSKQYAQCLLYTTPLRICHNETL